MSALWPLALLVAMLAASWAARHRLLRVDPGGGRGRAYARVVVRQLAGFALPAIVALALLGMLPAIRDMPAPFAGLAATLGIDGALVIGDGHALAVGALIGSAIGTAFEYWRWRRSGRRGPLFGEIGWLLARDRRDLAWGVALSLAAGVAEELYFRLALPLLVTLASGSALVGFGAATIAFAAAHRYQGRAGVIGTGAIGVLLAALYLASGALWLAIAAHVVIDLNSLVLRPAVTGAWKRA